MIPRQSPRRQTVIALSCLLTGVLGAGCRRAPPPVKPGIEFTRVPPKAEGNADELDPIEGRVQGTLPGQRVVLFALSGVWWVQPLGEQPFTTIEPDSTWKSLTHPGTSYAALLVDSRYRPPLTVKTLPEKGGAVIAEAVAEGGTAARSKTLGFSGYQWEVRQTASDHGGFRNLFHADNAWTDANGFLHLRVSKEGNDWVSAEVKLSRSLGYGSYRFVVRDVSHLEPAAVFAMFTVDDAGPAREMDIEVSRWGEPQDKSAQFVVQPYVVPANTIRFETPPGTLKYWMDWVPGRVSFRSERDGPSGSRSEIVADHVFTSGVPSAGQEKIHMNVYVYNTKRYPVTHEFEVVIEKFEFLP